MFMSRLVLAATLAASYGIYGPAYELLEHTPRSAGSEEYLDSEKYQLRHWDLDRARQPARRSSRASTASAATTRRCSATAACGSCAVDNDQLIAYAKQRPTASNVVVIVVNLDPHNTQSGWIGLDPAAMGVEAGAPYQVHDLLSDQRFLWQARGTTCMLDPRARRRTCSRVRRRVRNEKDFEYFA